ncbi:unnamed protein product, partial [Bubo scandiacus]
LQNHNFLLPAVQMWSEQVKKKKIEKFQLFLHKFSLYFKWSSIASSIVSVKIRVGNQLQINDEIVYFASPRGLNDMGSNNITLSPDEQIFVSCIYFLISCLVIKVYWGFRYPSTEKSPAVWKLFQPVLHMK